jgi:hypothetical protein
MIATATSILLTHIAWKILSENENRLITLLVINTLSQQYLYDTLIQRIIKSSKFDFELWGLESWMN